MAQGETYDEFVDKFKPKKTTDDCYTPPEVYETVKNWACKRYGLDSAKLVRPFWPGGDYEHFDYPEDCVVLDNPPFSIQSKIINFYNAHGIKYFLFVNGRTALNLTTKASVILGGKSVTYENGAKVCTHFATNLGDNLLECAPELSKAIASVEPRKSLPAYSYPHTCLTQGFIQYLAAHPVPYVLKRGEARFMHGLRGMRKIKKSGPYGGCLLLSEKAAAEKAARELREKHKIELEPEELAIVAELSAAQS